VYQGIQLSRETDGSIVARRLGKNEVIVKGYDDPGRHCLSAQIILNQGRLMQDQSVKVSSIGFPLIVALIPKLRHLIFTILVLSIVGIVGIIVLSFSQLKYYKLGLKNPIFRATRPYLSEPADPILFLAHLSTKCSW